MIDGSEKRNRQLAFELQNSHVCEKRSNSQCLRVNSLELPSAFLNKTLLVVYAYVFFRVITSLKSIVIYAFSII